MASTENTLKDQFDALQLRNMEKFERLKQQELNCDTKVPKGESFGVADDLGLTTSDLMTSAKHGLQVTLEDANNRMMEEIRELKDETGRLRKTLAEKEYLIKRCTKKVEKLENDKRILADAGTGIASDAAASKIVELSKRNRELTAEMESEKSKSMQFMKQVKELEKRLSEQDPRTTPRTKKVSPRTAMSLNNEYFGASIEDVVEKLNSANLKSSEYRNQIQSLKQELKVANKVLCSELGESSVNIQALLATDGAGYRGRMLQIKALQEKVKEMESKLSSSPQSRSNRGDKNLERIKVMEKQRKEMNEKLRLELDISNEQQRQLQQKLDASKARNKVLSAEVKSVKSQMNVLSDKGQHDDELITTLLRQQENLQNLLEKTTQQQETKEKSEYKVSKEVYEQQQRDKSEVNRLKQILNERNSKIQELENEIQELKLLQEEESEYRPLKVFSSQKSASSRSPNHDNTSSSNGSPIDTLSQQQLEEMQLLKIKNVELLALITAAEVERDRLSELVQVLNERIQSGVQNEQSLNKSLHDEKRRAAAMEHDLERQRLTSRDSSFISNETNIRTEEKLEEIKTQLSIQVDENQALKEALESTLRSKQDDVKLFSNMMEQTKSVFLEALRSLKG